MAIVLSRAPSKVHTMTLPEWAARRRQARYTLCALLCLLATFSCITYAVIPKHLSGMGLHWPQKRDSGLTLQEVTNLVVMATVMGVGMTAAQDILWPIMDPVRKGEKVRGRGGRR